MRVVRCVMHMGSDMHAASHMRGVVSCHRSVANAVLHTCSTGVVRPRVHHTCSIMGAV